MCCLGFLWFWMDGWIRNSWVGQFLWPSTRTHPGVDFMSLVTPNISLLLLEMWSLGEWMNEWVAFVLFVLELVRKENEMPWRVQGRERHSERCHSLHSHFSSENFWFPCNGVLCVFFAQEANSFTELWAEPESGCNTSWMAVWGPLTCSGAASLCSWSLGLIWSPWKCCKHSWGTR